jgi:exportin-2 (importin alpha re-exporter)
LTKALADADAFVTRYPKGWALTTDTLLKLLVNPPQLTSAQMEDHITEQDPDDPSFGVGFTQLNTCKRSAQDPYPEASGDLRNWVGQYLTEANARTGGRIAKLVGERLNEEQRGNLMKVMGG